MSRGFRRVVGAFSLLASVGVFGTAASADESWPQWGGPRRDFTCDAPKLIDAWTDDGPREVWSREIGSGHSAIVAADGVLYTMCRRAEQDAVVALSAATGETLWETRYDAPMKPGMQLEFGPGPHSTPLLAGDGVYTVGATVLVHCLDRKSGEVRWKHDLMEELRASHIGRGYGASPIAYKDTIIMSAGGQQTGLIALRQSDGEIVWKTGVLRTGYSSPILVEAGGQAQLVLAAGPQRLAVDPGTGETLWTTTVNQQSAAIMSTPVWLPPDRLFCSAAYGGGTRVFRVAAGEDGAAAPEELWHTIKMKVHHGNVIVDDGVAYGSSGDFGAAFLMAIDVNTGEILWRERGFAKATLLKADDKLIILDETGKLALTTASREGLKVHCEAQVLEEKSWTVPTLVGSRLYLRDNKTIKAVELGGAG